MIVRCQCNNEDRATWLGCSPPPACSIAVRLVPSYQIKKENGKRRRLGVCGREEPAKTTTNKTILQARCCTALIYLTLPGIPTFNCIQCQFEMRIKCGQKWRHIVDPPRLAHSVPAFRDNCDCSLISALHRARHYLLHTYMYELQHWKSPPPQSFNNSSSRVAMSRSEVNWSYSYSPFAGNIISL